MIMPCWNIRCYNDPIKHGSVHDNVVAHKVDAICLLEIKVCLGREQTILHKYRDWNHVINNTIESRIDRAEISKLLC